MLPFLQGCFPYVLSWGVLFYLLGVRISQHDKEKIADIDKNDRTLNDAVLPLKRLKTDTKIRPRVVKFSAHGCELEPGHPHLTKQEW